jgi:hypothetical protein
MGLPRLARIFQPELEPLQSQWNELVNFTERDLEQEQPLSANATCAGSGLEEMPYVLADTSSCAGAEDEIMLVHGSTVLPEPSLWLEFVGIWTIDIFVTPYNSGVHANAVTSGNLRSRYLEPTDWRDSRHSQANAWVQTHCFFDGCAQER